MSINSLQSHSVDPDAVGRSNIALTRVVTTTFKSPLTRILIDTGASYSVISADFLRRLKRDGLRVERRKTKRCTPSSASNHKMTILGDVILNLRFQCQDGELELRDIRFTILENLVNDLILGIEVIASLDLSVGETHIQILNRRIPVCERKFTVKAAVIKAVTTDDGFTIASLRVESPLPQGTGLLDRFLLSPILPIDDDNVYLPTAEKSVGLECYDKCLVEGRELQATFDYHFGMEKSELPKTLELTLEEVDDNIDWKPTINKPTIQVLEDRKELVGKEIIDAMVEESDFRGTDKCLLQKLLWDKRAVFSASEFDVGSYEDETITLELRDTDPVYVKPRRVPYKLKDVLSNSIREMCEKKIIQETRGSNYNSPVHLVRKRNSNKWRFCTDFRQLNEKLKQNRHPLPRIQDLLEKLGGAKFLTSVDLKHGFFNINLSEDCREYTAFSVEGKQYEYLKLPMGLSVSPQIFQRIMMGILKEELDKGIIVYLDDILVYSKTAGEHLRLLKTMLGKLSSAGILLNPNKCLFARKELDYLGFTICEQGYRAQKSKTEAIVNFPVPKDKASLKRFIGMIGFYSNLIRDLQFILGPLHSISGKTAEFVWGAQQEEAFVQAKERLAHSATLAFPRMDQDSKLILSTDASHLGWGAVLTEMGPEGIERPIGFTSGRFRNSSLNWVIAEKEAYAFVQALNFFYVYLYGYHFILRTDNRCLSFINSKSFTTKPSGIPNEKTLRWLELMAQFSFSIEHHVGTAACMATPDCLSRQFEGEPSRICELTERKFKKPFWVKHSLCLADMKEAQEKDSDLQAGRGLWASCYLNKGFKTVIEDGVIYLQNGKSSKRLAIPKDLLENILNFHHLPLHKSQKILLKEIRKRYCYPKLETEIAQYIKRCEICVAVKPKKKPATSTTLMSQSHHPWEALQCDLVGPLERSPTGCTYILSVIDTFTRWCELRPIRNRSSLSVAEGLLSILYVRGPCLNLQTDNAREFQSEFFKGFLRDMGIYQQPICPYRPQTNGVVESLNKRIKQKMQLMEVDSTTWALSLPAIQLALNLEILQEFGTSPFQLMHGWVLEPTDFVEKKKTAKATNIQPDRLEWSKTARVRMAHALTEHFCNDRAVKAKRISATEDLKPLKPGTKVLRYFKQPPTECAKLFRNWKGGFEVKEQLDKDTYVICRSEDGRRKFIAHRETLRVIGDPMEEESSKDHDETSPDANSTEDGRREDEEEPRREISGSCVPTGSQEENYMRRSKRLRGKMMDYSKFFSIIPLGVRSSGGSGDLRHENESPAKVTQEVT